MSFGSGRCEPDYDRCGWGTAWGCGIHLQPGDDVSIVMNACAPEDMTDNGHRLFHAACLPVQAKTGGLGRKLMQELDLRSERAHIRAV